MHPDFKELLSAFNAARVRYLIVGGYAVSPPVMVDIMPRIGGVEFEQAWGRRVDVRIDDDLSVAFISREDLLAAKLSAGRAQDLIDVDALRESDPSREIEQQEHAAFPATAASELDEIRRKGREEWLKHRAQEGAPPSLEDIRAKGREDWLKLRERTREGSQQDRAEEKGLDTEPKGPVRSPDKGLDEDIG